jgi:hypothetical protein
LARQNLLKRFEDFIQRIFEGPFAFLFPSRLEPVEILRRLEHAMDDNTLLQGEGRRLVPNVYNIYLSDKDYQQLAPSQTALIPDWKSRLIEHARQRRYTLRTEPVLHLHTDGSLGTGTARIEAKIDHQSGSEGVMATQALSAEQLAQLRAMLPPGQNLPGIPSATGPVTNPAAALHSMGGSVPRIPTMPTPMPQAWLTIQLPQGKQEIFRIEKAIVGIGRQLSNDIIVEDKRVSRYHAQVKYQADDLFMIFDLGSTNGITINGTPNMRQHTLRNGDRFTIGSYDFYFQRR